MMNFTPNKLKKDGTKPVLKVIVVIIYLIQNSPAVKKCAAPKNAGVKKDVKSKVAAKK